MKTVGAILDEIDERAAKLAEKCLDPDRAPFVRNEELHRRRELLKLKEFILEQPE